MAKAAASAADAVILDLEDAVAPSQKKVALASVIEFVTNPAEARFRLLVRVNSGEHGLDDLEHLIRGCGDRVSTYYLPKSETLEQVQQAVSLLGSLETELGLPDGSFSIVPLIESACGLLNASLIASAPRVKRLAIGEADLVSELGIELSPDDRELLTARSLVLIASIAAGIEVPMGPVSTNFTDLDALRDSSVALRRMGFRGRSCIHPHQLAVVNDVFTPTAAQIEQAHRIVALYDAALLRGEGAVLDEDGRMLDEAVVRSARRLAATFPKTRAP
jgi:citrate lyase subunit beta / citryl-CoA lyase